MMNADFDEVAGSEDPDTRRARPVVLDEAAAKRLLGSWGIAVPAGTVVTTPEEAVQSWQQRKEPCALKILRTEVVHKAAVGGIELNLRDPDRVKWSATRLLQTFGPPLLLEAQVQGPEFLVSLYWDQDFGYVMLVGAGGRDAESEADVSAMLCPCDEAAIIDAIAQTRIGSRLADRGGVTDIARLVHTLGGDGSPALDGHYIQVELNPVMLTEGGPVAVDALIIRDERVDRRYLPLPATTDFARLFQPDSVAVIGASASSSNTGNRYLEAYRRAGFGGALYAVHPTATTIDGVPCVPSLGSIKGGVDYTLVAVPAESVPHVLSEGNFHFAQVMSSGFREAGDEGAKLEAATVGCVRAVGGRLIGPNCLGTFSPRGHQTFLIDVQSEPGNVAFLSQSGGLTGDVIRMGSRRGIRFSKCVSAGNCADVRLWELVQYLADDPETSSLGIYVEDARDGRRLAEALRLFAGPIVLLRGGRSTAGSRMARSHTGALAADDRVWSAVENWANVVSAKNLTEFLAILTYFGRKGRDGGAEPHANGATMVFGPGGGTSVLAADSFSDRGVELRELGPATQGALRDLGFPPGPSFRNPVDTGVGAMVVDTPKGDVVTAVVSTVLEREAFRDVVVHLNVANFLYYVQDGRHSVERLVSSMGGLQAAWPRTRISLVLRGDPRPSEHALYDRLREMAVENDIPTVGTLEEAATGVAAIQRYEKSRERRLMN